ncbi:MAG TPA: ABC transporter permease [Caulobacteraceae bacterium]|jgi:NitT/TauT family transport system permease protein|nr:ABC transporter permease [Caulobacteraceae bacterium]
MKRLVDILAPLILVVAVIAIWQAACTVLDVPSYFLPKPTEVVAALIVRWPLLLQAAWNTFVMAILALVFASAVATALALGSTLSGLFERAVRPVASILQVTPVMALAPLIQVWSGLDHALRAVVALAAVIAFFPIFSGVFTGLKSADPDLERLFDLYDASPTQRLFKLRLPSAIPFIIEGHRVGLGLSIVGAVVAEFVAGSGQTQGLAWRIVEAQHRLQIADMIAALVALVALALALNVLLSMFERYALRRWGKRPALGVG